MNQMRENWGRRALNMAQLYFFFGLGSGKQVFDLCFRARQRSFSPELQALRSLLPSPSLDLGSGSEERCFKSSHVQDPLMKKLLVREKGEALPLAEMNMVYLTLVILVGNYHYSKYVPFFSRGLKQMDDLVEVVGSKSFKSFMAIW